MVKVTKIDDDPSRFESAVAPDVLIATLRRELTAEHMADHFAQFGFRQNCEDSVSHALIFSCEQLSNPGHDGELLLIVSLHEHVAQSPDSHLIIVADEVVVV